MGSIAETVMQRIDDKLAFDLGNRAPDHAVGAGRAARGPRLLLAR